VFPVFITIVDKELTGIHWLPVFEILEAASFKVLSINA